MASFGLNFKQKLQMRSQWMQNDARLYSKEEQGCSSGALANLYYPIKITKMVMLTAAFW